MLWKQRYDFLLLKQGVGFYFGNNPELSCMSRVMLNNVKYLTKCQAKSLREILPPLRSVSMTLTR